MRTFYRGSVNNGVHTLLTEQAHWAAQQIWELRRDALPAAANAADVLAYERQVADGTFTFVGAGNYDDDVAQFVTGTLDDLDQWIKGHRVLASPYPNFVPFSSKPGAHPVGVRLTRYIRTPRDVVRLFELTRAV